MKGFLKRLENQGRDEQIVIPQKDGTVRRFPKSASREAFDNLMQRLGAGDEAPPEHAMIGAVRNSSDPEWASSFYGSCKDPEAWAAMHVEDLSEP
jgi:hypothetical protein